MPTLPSQYSVRNFGGNSKYETGLWVQLDFFFDYWRRLPASNFILQDRRCRELSSPFPTSAGFTQYRNPPKVKIRADGVARCCAEADDLESPSSTLSAPLSSEIPILTEGCVTEDSRFSQSTFYPYGSPPGKRGIKKNTKANLHGAPFFSMIPRHACSSRCLSSLSVNSENTSESGKFH